MRLVGGDLQFLQGELRSAWAIAFGQHSAGGKNFDYVDAILHLRAHHVANLLGRVGDLVVAFFGEEHHPCLGRVVVQIAVAAGNGDRGAASHDAWADDESLINAVAQIDRHERPGPHITNAGEARQQRRAGVLLAAKPSV